MAFHRVLCPVDFSDFSRRALQYANALAVRDSADLHVVHIYPEVGPSAIDVEAGASPENLSVREASIDALDAFVKEVGVTPAAKRLALPGSPAQDLVDYAREMGADLIVLGTHGRTGFERVLVGSVAEHVLHKAACPVLTIPRAATRPDASHPARLAQILCAVDLSAASTPVVERALALAGESGAKLTLLHVVETMWDEHRCEWAEHRVGQFMDAQCQRALTQLRAMVPEEVRARCEVCERVEAGSARRAILRVAGDTQADLIVMGAQGRGGVGLLLFGSTTHSVVREAACPVLTVRSRANESSAAHAA